MFYKKGKRRKTRGHGDISSPLHPNELTKHTDPGEIYSSKYSVMQRCKESEDIPDGSVWRQAY